MSPPVNDTGLDVGNTCAVVIGGTYRGSTGVVVKETDFRYKIRLSTGREVYLKKDNVKCAEAHGDVTNSLVYLPALVVGGS